MPSSRTAKQIVYGIFYFVVFSGIVSGVYFGFLRNPASCFDGRQNQGEEGVDCGGPCESCEIRKLMPLTAGSVKVLFAGANATLFAEVRNQNFTFGAASLTYAFEVKDGAGRVVKVVSGESFVYPGEIKYFVEPAAGVSQGGVSGANFTISNVAWKRKEEFPTPLMQFREVKTEEKQGGTLTTSGVIVNGETVPFRRLIVGALYVDQFGAVAGASTTELRDVRPFEERFFQITHPALPGFDLRATKLYFEGRR
ncbi:MAG: hypothetical protein A3G64_00460 [Candidatus Liptonbacteria bacterium RIFCSPLOWO2_12_FULL_60_15]|uniref:Uncharacterized protein n=1 Tax=Candidatus Liptonbacteria bacterium RIFCSPLOWO2_12_FULL_60_15 TaxID=1798653 RepID=A0A1G2CN20_9BACT|nr:MAG: hypothetical protein A3G64_00460 [Candidatus Liptonbacteria bacterium RIFCSPLOWO2_12_FULL_60_15]